MAPKSATLELVSAPEPVEVEGPHCIWRAPEKEPWQRHSATALKIEDLIAEAVDSLYQLHWTNVSHLYGPMGLGPGGWEPMARERRNFLDATKRNKGAAKYGVTFDRVRWTWEHLEVAPASLTELGAAELNEEHPHPCPTCVREGKEATCKSHVFKRGDREYLSYKVQGTLQDLQRQWITLFVTDVQGVLASTDEVARRMHLETLINRLRQTMIGTAEGVPVMRRLREQAKGKEALRLLRECRATLLRRLEAIASAPTTRNHQPTTNERGPQPKSSAPTFRALLGDTNLETTLAGIRALGHPVTPHKGKGAIVACMEAALEHFKVSRQPDKYWPAMLNEQFPGINASAKAVPGILRHASTRYVQDRLAMLNHLKS